MARPDGRIEKGQRLSSAISARAWNRAQEAADRVLGVTPGIEAAATSGNLRAVTIAARWSKTNANSRMAQWPSHIQALPEGHKLHIGFSVPLLNEVYLNAGSVAKNAIGDLAVTVLDPFLTLGLVFNGSEHFGVIQSVSEDESYYNLTLVIGGVFVCRCLSFAISDRLAGPAGIPVNENIKPLWYPYPVMSPAGSAKVLAVGNYWKPTGNEWPRIYEVLVSM